MSKELNLLQTGKVAWYCNTGRTETIDLIGTLDELKLLI